MCDLLFSNHHVVLTSLPFFIGEFLTVIVFIIIAIVIATIATINAVITTIIFRLLAVVCSARSITNIPSFLKGRVTIGFGRLGF